MLFKFIMQFFKKISPKKDTNKKQETKTLTQEQQKNLENLKDAISAAWLDEFMEYIQSPWKMLWPNFVAGVARGVGALIGAAIVLALIGWILAQIISLPLIGEKIEPYIQNIQNEINKYTESTNYKPHFIEMEKILKDIRNELKK